MAWTGTSKGHDRATCFLHRPGNVVDLWRKAAQRAEKRILEQGWIDRGIRIQVSSLLEGLTAITEISGFE
jgi:hypothetical protein